MTGRVLLVEDDAALSAGLATSLRLAGHEVEVASDGAAVLARLDARFEGVVVSDLRMPGMDGWQFFEGLRALDPDLPLIFITGHGDIDAAVRALQQGAYDFLAKPFAPARLIASLGRALEKRRLVLENRRLRAAAEADAEPLAGGPFAHVLPLAGESAAMTALRATLAHIGEAEIDVLIEAEAGTGRDQLARLLHDASRRRARAFVGLNCGAVPAAMLAEALYGDESGRRPRGSGPAGGKLALASRGTLFLDGIEAMDAALQARLGATLDGGALDAKPLDVRVIAATGTDLRAEAGAGRFNPALLVRLGALRLRIPPLRERREDVPLLFARLAADAARRFGGRLALAEDGLPMGVRAHLLGHDWPGNLRELAHYAERHVLGVESQSAGGGADAGGDGGGTNWTAAEAGGDTLAARMARIEAGLLREALSACDGRISAAVTRLGLPRKTLYDKLARHGIDPAAFRRRDGQRGGERGG